ncbi:uncharacterized protein LOC115548973 [Gadus morhua]|uniref:uncharacterized protein LOC115548973 n=1 Tax=Gadus morhua TaxID=8049 RepID=UPI0011B3F79C|nr:uncharacterized protein LOC115548973 [Gadus morhua]
MRGGHPGAGAEEEEEEDDDDGRRGAAGNTRLPEGWRTALSGEEQEWIGRALFQQTSGGSLKLTTDLKLWWDPPQPRLNYTQPPASAATFFACRLFLWAPLHMWGPRPTCCQKHLTKCGMYKTIRKVLDIDGWYLMATEYLECRRCWRKVADLSQEVVRQLGEGHRALFPAILTYKLACDRRVIIQLRERTRGGTAPRSCKKNSVRHTQRPGCGGPYTTSASWSPSRRRVSCASAPHRRNHRQTCRSTAGCWWCTATTSCLAWRT